MLKAFRIVAALVIVLALSSAVFAEAAGKEAPAAAGASAAPVQPNTGTGIGMGLAAVGAGVGIGLIGFAALSGIARQPEASGKIVGNMILLAALVEGAAIIAMVFSFVAK